MSREVSPSWSRTRIVPARGAAVECNVCGDDRATGSERRRRNIERDLDNREVIYNRDRKSGKKRIRIKATSKAIHITRIMVCNSYLISATLGITEGPLANDRPKLMITEKK